MKSVFQLNEFFNSESYIAKISQSQNKENMYFSVDVEADGQNPAVGSMIQLGCAVVGQPNLHFESLLKPDNEKFNPKALAVSGLNRDELLRTAPDPGKVMKSFYDWILKTSEGKNPVFVSDNSFDWSFVDFYLHKYVGNNPFGHSPRNLHDLHKGFHRSLSSKISDHREQLTHGALEDAQVNARYMQKLIEQGLQH